MLPCDMVFGVRLHCNCRCELEPLTGWRFENCEAGGRQKMLQTGFEVKDLLPKYEQWRWG